MSSGLNGLLHARYPLSQGIVVLSLGSSGYYGVCLSLGTCECGNTDTLDDHRITAESSKTAKLCTKKKLCFTDLAS